MLATAISASILTGVASSYRPASVFGAIAAAVAWRIIRECGTTSETILRGMRTSGLLPKGKTAAVLEPSQERV
jgi:hypothetical protein